MARRATRYEDGAKLNVKKVIAVILIILFIIVLIFGIKALLTNNSKSLTGKLENVYYYTIYDNGKWGVINSYGENVIDPTYDEMIVIPDNTKDIFICTYDVNYSNGDYKTKVINKKGKEIIKDYDKVEAIVNYDKNEKISYEKSAFIVQKNGKYGLVNYSGKELLAPTYDSIKALYGVENSLVIEKDGKFGICSSEGTIVIEPKYIMIEKIGDDYKNGYIVVNEENKCGIIGFDKEVILDNKYEEIKDVCGENIYAVKENDGFTLINKSGEKVIDNQFEDIISINKDLVVAVKDGKCGVVDISSGETKIDFKYDGLTYTNGSHFIARQDEDYGVVALDGTETLPIDSINMTYVSQGDFIIADYTENGSLISKVYDSNYNEKLKGVVSEINSTKGYIRIYQNDEYKYYNFKFEEKEASRITYIK